MVFSSIPTYLDPANWQQNNQVVVGSSSANPLLPPPPQPHGGGAGSGSIRPGSMAERARMANIQMPEASMKCPRCESVNTKFCYFNNYSLSQPRHFCKTCRRYWTRGGALRSVPVGGGCRRNKRSKSTSSKSPASGDRQTNSLSSTSTISSNMTSASGSGPAAAAENIFGLTPRFMSPLSQFTDNFNPHDNIGLNNYSGISTDSALGTSENMNFHLGSSSLFGGGVASVLSSSGGCIEPWRLQQFPFLGSLEPSSPGIYNHHFLGGEMGGGGGETSHMVRPKLSSMMLNQISSSSSSVKVEENPELNLSRQLMGGGIPRNDQWNIATSTTNWTDLSTNFNSFSTTNPL